jgi:membrane protein implicated in regulation of membrane protease activity
MIKTGWSRQAVFTYALLQVPGWLLVGLVLLLSYSYFQVPAWTGWLIFVLWAIKDIILFFFLWPAYDSQKANVYTLRGEKAIVVTELAPQGRVRLRGQTWAAKAENGKPIPQGTWVEITARTGLILIVHSIDKKSRG